MLDDIELITKFHRKLFLMQNFINKEITIKCMNQQKSSQMTPLKNFLRKNEIKDIKTRS